MPVFSKHAVVIVDGETGTFKTSTLKELGANVQWRNTHGQSDTRPEDVKVYRTHYLPMLDPMGRNDTKNDGSSLFSEYSNLHARRLIVEQCRKEDIRHLNWYQLHVRASPRSLDDIRRTIQDVSAFLEGQLGYLVILVAHCFDPSDMTGIKELLSEDRLPSKNGRPVILPFYPPHHIPPPSIVATERFIDIKEGDYEGNWAQMKRYMPRMGPYEFVFQNEHCTTCDQTGDRRLMGPCHKGPIRREHDTPVQVHCHPKSTEEIHGDIVPARGSRLLDRAGKILAPVNPLAAAGAALAGVGIELFEADKCSPCGKCINTPGCMLRWECCKNEQDAEGCKEIQQCSNCREEIGGTQGCLVRCMSCNKNPTEAESGCDYFNKVAHVIEVKDA